MTTTILIRSGSRWFKARVNPLPKNERDMEEYVRLMKAYVRQKNRGRIASQIRIERQIQKLEEKILKNNPLIKSVRKSSVGKNISYLMKHQEELTAKTPEMRRKQAIAIALSTWRRAMKKERRS